MGYPKELVLGLALAAMSGAAFVPPGVGSCSWNPTTSSPTRQGSDSCDVQARGSSVTPIKSTLGVSFDGIVRLFQGTSTEKPTLPQDSDADKAAREKELEQRKEDYQWSYDGVPVGTPYLEGFPPTEQIPSLSWITKAVSAFLRIFAGTLGGTIGPSEVIDAVTNPDRAKSFVSRIQELIKDTAKDERPFDIEDYEELHAFPLKLPSSGYDWENDEAFARLRLQGANCVVIEKCTDTHRAKLKILDTDASYKDLKEKVDSLMETGKLFVVDHKLLDGMETDKLDDTYQRYLAPGIALFEVVDDDLLPLRPLGIQLSQGHTATPIFTPQDPEYTWKIAKASFEAADFILHEVVSHLGNTHVVLEGAMVALYRCFPEAHPIFKLMEPHFEGTAFINWAAQELLIVPDGGLERLQANVLESSWTLALEKVLERIEKDFSPPQDFAARKMTTVDFPGRYPYRDFGTMYWDAIYTWVDEYLKIYYTSDADVEGDYELKGFVDEMVNKASFKWLNEYYTSNDKRGLIIKVLASIIYSASVLHTAVNYPQRTSMSFVPSCPGSMYVPIPTDKKERTFEEFLAYLPGLEISVEQITILTLLGSVYHTELGEYEGNHFTDDRVAKPLEKFQQTIELIGVEVSDTNAYLVNAWRQRGKDKRQAQNFGYTTLLPEKIPQSTNI